MKTSITFALVLSFAFLANAVPQAPQPQPGNNRTNGPPLSIECRTQSIKSGAMVIEPCTSAITPLLSKGEITLNSSTADKANFILTATKSICSDQCFNNARTAVKEIEGKCAAPDSRDEKLMWATQHVLFARDLFCLKEGDQLCVNKAVENAKSKNVLDKVFQVLTPPTFTPINDTNAPPSEPGKRNPKAISYAIQYINTFANQFTDLPNDIVCTSCQKSMSEQAYVWYNTVFGPRISRFGNQPELTTAIDNLVKKANDKCGANWIAKDAKLVLGQSAQAQLSSAESSYKIMNVVVFPAVIAAIALFT
ncbi:hypothetical protein BKA69DRAFT_1124576 [Paraphysoderma sedebokerense]|nr:hypothetical protein BKA69DRAFT_1124576 [Paraphysoderma sedebokerense]